MQNDSCMLLYLDLDKISLYSSLTDISDNIHKILKSITNSEITQTQS